MISLAHYSTIQKALPKGFGPPLIEAARRHSQKLCYFNVPSQCRLALCFASKNSFFA